MSLFCLVHGAWHDETCWNPLIEVLESRGHECLAPRLPLEDRNATFPDYAAVVSSALPEDTDAVLVGHSMSSAVIPLIPGLRSVAQLIYLCPAMAGFELLPGEPDYKRQGYVGPVKEGGVSRWAPERARVALYGRLDPDLAASLAAKLRPQPAAPFDAPYPLARPPEIDSAFIYGREDEIFDDGWSRWISRALLGVEPVELPGGHFPMLEHPLLLADALEQALL